MARSKGGSRPIELPDTRPAFCKPRLSCSGGAQFRMTQVELLFLQSGAGAGNVAEPAVLGLPDGAVWQVPAGIFRAYGQGARQARGADRFRAEGRMDPCCLGRRGAGGAWVDRAAAADVPGLARGGLDDY